MLLQLIQNNGRAFLRAVRLFDMGIKKCEIFFFKNELKEKKSSEIYAQKLFSNSGKNMYHKKKIQKTV